MGQQQRVFGIANSESSWNSFVQVVQRSRQVVIVQSFGGATSEEIVRRGLQKMLDSG